MITYAAIEHYNEDDILLWSTDIKDLKQVPSFWDKLIQYNQYKNWHFNWCVFYSWVWCLSDQFGKTIEKRQFDEIAVLAKDKYWRDPNSWMYLSKWAELIEEISTKYFWVKVHKHLIRLHDKEAVIQALKKWYSIHTGYRWNESYNKDAWDNCVVEKDDFGSHTYWHAIRLTFKDWKIYVVDNYVWSQWICNVYTFKDFFALVNKWIFFRSWYIYYSDNNMENVKADIPVKQASNKEEEAIIKTWLLEVKKEDRLFNNYADSYAINKMLIDIAFKRKK